ncbi:MAG TPA: GNAT family N-acetyltransferase [Acidimicrobiia bacterium]
MDIVSVDAGRIEEAAATLARAMLDEPLGRWLLPDPVEFLEVHERLFVKTMMRALEEGRVDAWGDPFVGVAVWFERPAIDEDPNRTQPASDFSSLVPGHAAARVDEVARLLRLMRRQARPDRHVYLDSIGVLPEHRRRGNATGLMGAGLDWADALALPCSLETLNPDNVAFYRRQGFEVVATEPLEGSGLTITSMRRPPP